MTYKHYPKYKDSGVEWIGDVPEHWRVASIKRMATIANGATPESKNTDYWDGDITWFTPADLDNEIVTTLDCSARCITQSGLDSCAARLTPAGSVVLSTRAPVGSVGITTTVSATNQGCRTLVPKVGVSAKLLAEMLVSARGELAMQANGTIFQELSKDSLSAIRLVEPPNDERADIIAAIDREAARTDALIAKKTRFIDLLREKRQALITHAVTKGLDPTAPMKDSGVEWIGEVPTHWRVCALSYLAAVATGGTPDRRMPAYWNGEIPWIKTGEVNYTDITSAEESITVEGLHNSAAYMARPGTILMAMYGMGVTRGRVAILGIPAAFNQACAGITCSKNSHNRYVYLFLLAAYRFIRDLANEASQANLSVEIIRKLKIAVPPLNEQAAIVEQVCRKSSRIDVLIARTEHSIELLRERRSAFITAAVTGRIDLRDEVDVRRIEAA